MKSPSHKTPCHESPFRFAFPTWVCMHVLLPHVATNPSQDILFLIGLMKRKSKLRVRLKEVIVAYFRIIFTFSPLSLSLHVCKLRSINQSIHLTNYLTTYSINLSNYIPVYICIHVKYVYILNRLYRYDVHAYMCVYCLCTPFTCLCVYMSIPLIYINKHTTRGCGMD